jgi:NAD(P)-dependent dehydrogenase (short-subunit alcohol dehydrogenase family)
LVSSTVPSLYNVLQIRVNSVNPGIVWTDMAKQVWSRPERAEQLEQMRQRYPLGKFLGKAKYINTFINNET